MSVGVCGGRGETEIKMDLLRLGRMYEGGYF